MISYIVGIIRWSIARKNNLEEAYAVPKVSWGFSSKTKFYLGVIHFIEMLLGRVENVSPVSSSFHA